MRRLFWIVATLALWPSAGAAQCRGTDLLAQLKASDPAAHAALFEHAHRVPNAEGKFWRVRRAGAAPSWLFGTFHDTGIAREPLEPGVAAALGATRLMMVEVTEEEQARMQARIVNDPGFAFMRGGNGVFERLAAVERAAAQRFLARRGVSLANARLMRPWLLFSLLAVPLCVQREMREGQPMLDNLLIAQARQAGVPVAGLENYMQVPAAISAIPPKIMNDILVETLRDLSVEEDTLRTSARLYKAGEIAAIWEFSVHSAAETLGMRRAREVFAAFAETLIDARNRAWIKVLEPELMKGGVFAAFGALHLPGETGVIELLRARGFEVTRLDG